MTHPHKRNTDGLGRSYRAIHLINFQFLYPRKTGDISKVWNLTEGKTFWNASHSNTWISGGEENMQIQKIARKKMWKFRQKCFDKNGPKSIYRRQ